RDSEAQEPPDGRALAQDGVADDIRHRVVRMTGRDDRRRAGEQRPLGLILLPVRRVLVRHYWCPPSPRSAAAGVGSSSVLGFRTTARYVVRGLVFSSSSNA